MGKFFFHPTKTSFFFFLPMWVKFFFSFYVWVKFFFFTFEWVKFFFLQKHPAPPLKSNGASLTDIYIDYFKINANYARLPLTQNKLCQLLSFVMVGQNGHILSVAMMSQIGILTPDWSIAAVPCYSPE